MKNTKLGYIFTAFVLVTVIFAVFAGAVLAGAGFEEAVLAIDKSKSWEQRRAAADRAEALFLDLSLEERSEAADLYTVLAEELADLQALENKAERFILYVDTLSDLSDLNEKEEAVTLAKSEGVYFADESYPGITEAINTLSDFEERVNTAVLACIAFMDAVDEAQMTDTEDYLALKAALTEAEQYYNSVDITYDGIRDARGIYATLTSELRVREQYTEEFLREANKLKEKTDYKSYTSLYNEVLSYMSDESFIEAYPGVSEADAILDEADAYIKECINKANVFITAVSRFGSSSNIASDLILAYRALDGVDLTVTGVSAAKAVFDSTLRTYNDIVKQIIKDLELI